MIFKKNGIVYNIKKKIKSDKLSRLFATSTPISRIDCRLFLLEHQFVIRKHRASILCIIGDMRLIYDYWKVQGYTKKNRSSPAYCFDYIKFWGLKNSLYEEINEHYCFYDLFIGTNDVSPEMQKFIENLLLDNIKPGFNDFPSENSLKKLEGIIYSYMLQIAYLVGLMDNIKRFKIAIYETPLTNRSC